ncbi:MAG: stage V sporulation protein B [Clostridiaceae bacterium]|nr:stage V sporulation protein B [Clostridiaceae bacterium]
MSKDNFLKNSLILSLSNSTMGILRFIFSVILSKDLGPEGMGLYSLIMPIFDLFCCLVCGGLIAAISKEGAVYFDKGDYKNLNNSIKATMFFDLFWSIFIAIAVFLMAPFISNYIIKDSRSLYSIQVLCPALVFIALSSIIKGYFYGISHVTVPAIIDIVEKAIRISVVVGLIGLIHSKNITNTVTLVYIALSIGEFTSFILLYIYYRIYRRKYYTSSFQGERKSQLLFNILVVSIPLCLNGFLSTALAAISTLIIPLRLVVSGFSHTEALSMIGRFTGMSLSITLFPIMIVTSVSVVLVPDISQSLSKKDFFGLQSRIEGVLRFSLLVGIATLIVCLCIPKELGMLFFNRSDLGDYIKFSAISAPFVYASVTTFSILSGLGKQKAILRISILTSIEELILLYILAAIPSINIYSYGISLTITCITTLILNLIEIKGTCYITIPYSKLSIDILISILTYLIISILNNVLTLPTQNLKNIFILIFSFALFFSLTYFSNKKIN